MPASPIVADVLRRARAHQRLSLRQVEQRIGVPNAHISQIERGVIRRPDVAILMELAELYELDYQLLAQWAGYLDPDATRTSSKLAGMALRLFASLDPAAQHEALNMLEELRNGTMHARHTAPDEGGSASD
jgi:transcriptional regulator with XRE-family HTH domain